MVDHPIIIRGLALDGAAGTPTILKRTDSEFVEAILDELAGKRGASALGETVMHRQPDGQQLKLYQPVHRIFHVVVLEVVCDTFGQPRLDPHKIESAGLVIRRLPPDSASSTDILTQLSSQTTRSTNARAKLDLTDLTQAAAGDIEGWMQAGTSLRGWMPLGTGADADPDPERRRPATRAGHPLIDQLLADAGQTPRSESVSPLFVAPPAICAAADKTLLYGLIPLSSAETSTSFAGSSGAPAMLQSAGAPQSQAMLIDDATIRNHLPTYLREGGARRIPRAGETLTYQDADTQNEQTLDDDDTDDLSDFILILRQLAVELDLFGTSNTSKALFAALNQIALPFTQLVPPAAQQIDAGDEIYEQYTRPASEFLRDAVAVLVEQNQGSALIMPDAWPPISAQHSSSILQAVRAAIDTQLPLVAGRGTPRFDQASRHYQLRAFVRVTQPGVCPPEIAWSTYSPAFVIAPWYESGGAPPVQVALPDATDRAFLKQLKPDIAFAVPESLFNLLNRNSPKDFLEGKAALRGPNIALDWICSFNIPVITICAFIALSILLSLFDLIFHWMMFIKVCIPFPRPK